MKTSEIPLFLSVVTNSDITGERRGWPNVSVCMSSQAARVLWHINRLRTLSEVSSVPEIQKSLEFLWFGVISSLAAEFVDWKLKD